jgi:hypothetical protein
VNETELNMLNQLAQKAATVERLCDQAVDKYASLQMLLQDPAPPQPPAVATPQLPVNGPADDIELQTFVDANGVCQQQCRGMCQHLVAGDPPAMTLGPPDATAGYVTGTQTIDDWIHDLPNSPAATQLSNLPTNWRFSRRANDRLEAALKQYETADDGQLMGRLSIVFEGESGIDRGGLTREFFETLFRDVMSLGTYSCCVLMEGEPGHQLPCATSRQLSHVYKSIGKMIVHAVRNGCHGLPGLSPAVQHYLINTDGMAFIEDNLPAMSIEDIADPELKNILEKLHRREDLSEVERQALELWMQQAHCPAPLTPSTYDLIVQDLMVHYIYHCRSSQLDALAKGLETLGLRAFLRQNPTSTNMSLVFPSPRDTDISVDDFMAAVTPRGKDERTLEFLRRFVCELGSGQLTGDKQISDLVQFLSGSSHLPQQVLVSFTNDIYYPAAHTCFRELELPLMHRDYNQFKDAMLFSLNHGTVFTSDRTAESTVCSDE